MPTYNINDKIKLILPSDFDFKRTEDDGEETLRILYGQFENDNGETDYEFVGTIEYIKYTPEELEDGTNKNNFLDVLAERVGDAKKTKLHSKPETMVLNASIALFNLEFISTAALIRVGTWEVIQLTTTNDIYDDPYKMERIYEFVYEILKAIRINGKKMQLNDITPQSIQESIEDSQDENYDVIREETITDETVDFSDDNMSSEISEDENQSVLNQIQNTITELTDTLAKIKVSSSEEYELKSDIQSKIDLGIKNVGTYSDYIERKARLEKAEQEEKAKKIDKARLTEKSEDDIVNMYIILTNEKKLGKLNRSDEDFFETYEEDFLAMSKDEVAKIRKDVLLEMEDAPRCSYYAKKFKQRTVKDRFSISTLNLNCTSNEPEIDVKASWAIESTKVWYDETEYVQVKQLMDESLAETRQALDNQLSSINEDWTRFVTAKKYLQIAVKNKRSDDSDVKENSSNFQVLVGSRMIEVQLASSGLFRMSTTVMDCYTWYWGVTVRDIWEAANGNELFDECDDGNGSAFANQAIEKVRTEQLKSKLRDSVYSNSDAISQAETVDDRDNLHSESSLNKDKSNEESPGKEGCYIATAVYGSYDAPEVLVLRKFRDEILAKSFWGRWFIRVYYRFSPSIARRLKRANRVNRFVRSILDKLVMGIKRKQ